MLVFYYNQLEKCSRAKLCLTDFTFKWSHVQNGSESVLKMRESALLDCRASSSVSTQLQIEMKAPWVSKPRKTTPLRRASVTDKDWQKCVSPNFSDVQENGTLRGRSVGLYLVGILLNLPAPAVGKYQTQCWLGTRVSTGNRELWETFVDLLRRLISAMCSIARGHS